MEKLFRICACTVMVGFLASVAVGVLFLAVGLYNAAQPAPAEQHKAENDAAICKLDSTACATPNR